MIYVYVSGPITLGDQIVNCRELVLASHALMTMGFGRYPGGHGLVPFNPGASAFSHAIDPQPYESWLKWDFAWVRRCDCLLAIRPWIESKGRDREILHAVELGRPVYRSLRDLVMDYMDKLGAPNVAAVAAFDRRWTRLPVVPGDLPADVPAVAAAG